MNTEMKHIATEFQLLVVPLTWFTFTEWVPIQMGPAAGNENPGGLVGTSEGGVSGFGTTAGKLRVIGGGFDGAEGGSASSTGTRADSTELLEVITRLSSQTTS